ncbi:MAG: hypothetical protein U9P14_09275 [Gemmatimonadota bacterium]|nr:hypothetical protein [Gemmatimonadota bacterium]
MKQAIILTALVVGLLLLLTLWAFDKLMVVLGKDRSFHFFNPRPYPVNPLNKFKPIGVTSAGSYL